MTTGISVEKSNRESCNFPFMSDVGKRVRKIRVARGLSMAELATSAGNLAYQTIQDLEKGKSRGSKHLLAIARALNVSPEWLETGEGAVPYQPDDLSVKNDGANIRNLLINKSNSVTAMSQSPLLSGEKIPILGLAECGFDGWQAWNGEVVDWADRPANLAGAKDAYAVFILGDSMVPRYQPGEIAFIHPSKPPTPGAYVLVQKRPKGPGEAPLAIIKRMVKRSGDKVILEQLNPPKTVTLAVADIVSMHRVVGSLEA